MSEEEGWDTRRGFLGGKSVECREPLILVLGESGSCKTWHSHSSIYPGLELSCGGESKQAKGLDEERAKGLESPGGCEQMIRHVKIVG